MVLDNEQNTLYVTSDISFFGHFYAQTVFELTVFCIIYQGILTILQWVHIHLKTKTRITLCTVMHA